MICHLCGFHWCWCCCQGSFSSLVLLVLLLLVSHTTAQHSYPIHLWCLIATCRCSVGISLTLVHCNIVSSAHTQALLIMSWVDSARFRFSTQMHLQVKNSDSKKWRRALKEQYVTMSEAQLELVWPKSEGVREMHSFWLEVVIGYILRCFIYSRGKSHDVILHTPRATLTCTLYVLEDFKPCIVERCDLERPLV